MTQERSPGRHWVVIVGGGLGGLYCARGLRRNPVDVTLIDRRNFHLFQPLLSGVERAEQAGPDERRRLLTFVVAGGGPNGVEMAGAIRELAVHTLKRDFRFFDPADAKVVLVESQPRVLAGFHETLSRKAGEALTSLGVEVVNGSRVMAVAPDQVIVTDSTSWAERRIDTETIIWAAGVKASPAPGSRPRSARERSRNR